MDQKQIAELEDALDELDFEAGKASFQFGRYLALTPEQRAALASAIAAVLLADADLRAAVDAALTADGAR